MKDHNTAARQAWIKNPRLDSGSRGLAIALLIALSSAAWFVIGLLIGATL